MYVPSVFSSGSVDLAWDIAEAFPFALLLVGEEIAPLPLLVDRERRTLRGHVAAANPIATRFAGPARVVFQGPHGYVSPTWYRDAHQHVPTWNYVIAEARGSIRALDPGATRGVVWELCRRFEGEGGYRPERADPDLVRSLLDRIVGFELQVERFEAKVKLSQNRDPEDREGVITALEGGDAASVELARWMRRFA